jgi:hypothetical protein
MHKLLNQIEAHTATLNNSKQAEMAAASQLGI